MISFEVKIDIFKQAMKSRLDLIQDNELDKMTSDKLCAMLINACERADLVDIGICSTLLHTRPGGSAALEKLVRIATRKLEKK